MKPRLPPNGGLVYSTEHGKMCPACRKPISQCSCKKKAPPPTGGIIRVRLETKGRRGKGVTCIVGVPLNQAELGQFLKELKQRCGSGGTIKDGTIEIQGDHVVPVLAELERKGWKAKRAGG